MRCKLGYYKAPVIAMGLICHGGGFWPACKRIALCWPAARLLVIR